MNKSKKAFIERVRTKLSRAVTDFRLIKSGDKILVAISGGKDSMGLLDILANRRKALKMDYQIKAIHIRLRDVPYFTDAEYLNDFCMERGIGFELIEEDKKIIKEGIQACFYCSWNRRRLIFEYAKQFGFNKVAFGHHKEDAVETLLMNMIYHGEISSFPVKIEMFKGEFTIIRPLIYLNNEEIKKYIEIIGYKPLPYDCKYAATNQRGKFKELMIEMKKINPKAIENIFNSMTNINERHLPIK